VPTYREQNLGGWLDRLRAHAGDAEILLIDDSPPDIRTALREAAAARAATVLDGPANGKGGAIRDGFRAARGEVIVMIDADSDEAALNHIPELVAKAQNGSDVVIAERQGRHAQLKRFILSSGFRWVQRIFIFHSLRFRDTQCGLKAFRRDAALQLAARQSVFGGLFDVEYLYIAICRRMRIAQLPIDPWPESRPSHLNLWQFLRTAPFDLLRVKMNGWRGRYSQP